MKSNPRSLQLEKAHVQQQRRNTAKNKLKKKIIKKKKRIEDNLRDIWDNIKGTNIRIIGVPEDEEENKGTEKILKRL